MGNIPATKLKTFEEVDSSLYELAQIESKLAKKEALMNEKIQKIKDQYDEETAQERAAKLSITQDVEGYLILNKSEFDKIRTKKLVHGTVGFRYGTPKVLNLSKKYSTKTVLELAKKLFKTKYVRQKEELNKDAILADYASGKLDDSKVASFGARIDKGETVVINIDWESLESAA